MIHSITHLPKTTCQVHALRWNKEWMVPGFSKNLLESLFSKGGENPLELGFSITFSFVLRDDTIVADDTSWAPPGVPRRHANWRSLQDRDKSRSANRIWGFMNFRS